MSDGFPASLVMRVHGRLTLHPWIAAAHREGRLEEDLFSLAVARTTAYGWADFGHGLGGARWGHNDAGGDWTQDGRAREIAWIQVDCAEAPAGQRVPLTPLGRVVAESLSRVGTFDVDAVEVSVPVYEAVDAGRDLAYAATWAGLADPAGRAECAVSVDAIADPAQAAAVVAACRERAGEAARFDHDGTRLLCGLREWSLDTAIWVLEIVTDALRVSGLATQAQVRIEV
ncbi:hypothetical protein [Streptomyces sp. AS02]|uniref:hypothetical protein n=1 Tax=Streptomyces sp. AS02 TaxID=2938946 RepID=UPI002020CCB6|nr:hypothetical protein [Streptomyces sp. AS02]MCL8014511.1 hypothetical protein [Streptomyces sp. AS02]